MLRAVSTACFGALVAATLAGCPDKKVDPPPPDEPQPTPARCELDPKMFPEAFDGPGTGAKAHVVTSPGELIGGQFAGGRVGDYLLENDRIRVVIDQPGRQLAHTPFGGAIIDADLKRAPGEAGRDQLGKLGFFYAFGRAFDTSRVEIVRDGSDGGPAVIAATGADALNDFITLQAALDKQQLGIKLLVDPDQPLPVRGTTWYVLAPGQDRVRMFTAICNDGDKPVAFPVGEISAGGGTMDFFNPGQCRGGLGQADCLVDPSSWFGWQGDGVAYGYRSFQLEDSSKPSTDALVYLSGSAAVLADMNDLSGVLRWVDPNATKRPGNFAIRPGEQKVFVRELRVAHDLAAIAEDYDTPQADPATTPQMMNIDLGITEADGSNPGAGVRVAVEDPTSGELLSVGVTDDRGHVLISTAAPSVRLTAARPGTGISVPLEVQRTTEAIVNESISLPQSQAITVHIRDPFGAPLPGKLVLRCSPGPCSPKPSEYARFTEIEDMPDDIALVGYVLPTGDATYRVPPGKYEAIVSRGPEYSLWPDTAPAVGSPVDLTTGDATVTATIARVVDTTGWMSADLHVHAVNSADASPANEVRVAAFASEGVEALVSTDHDFITDYHPLIESLGAKPWLANVIGDEISPIWGHQNAFPLTRTDSWSGGALDWAGGEGPSLRPDEIYAQVHAQPGALVQLNHPRGDHGTLTNLKVSTLTSSTTADPKALRMAPAPDATASDTRLFSLNFDAMELQNGFSPNMAVVNDWMVFLSRGHVKTGTSVSDTHTAFYGPSGYSRSFVKMDSDDPAAFDVPKFTQRIREHAVIGTNGPFLSVTAQKLDAMDQPIGAPVDVGGTLSITPGDKVRFTATVQAPEWMQFDRVELYTHADGREASDGVANSAWPASRILQQKVLDPAALPLEPVPGTNGQTFRRIKVVETFDVSPTADGWYVIMVRATGSGTRELFPLAFHGACKDGVCGTGSAKPFAFANPIFIDADGSGAYDQFPLPH